MYKLVRNELSEYEVGRKKIMKATMTIHHYPYLIRENCHCREYENIHDEQVFCHRRHLAENRVVIHYNLK